MVASGGLIPLSIPGGRRAADGTDLGHHGGDDHMTLSAAHVTTLASHLLARDAVAASALALDLLDAGVSVPRLLVELVGPAQELVGERWQRNEVTVADEHVASAIAEQLIATLTAIRHPEPGGPHVVVACAEGEWHVLPARLLVEGLRAEGFHISFLGPSMPARQLQQFIAQVRPDLVAVSCSTALSLDGVVGFVHVAHDAGIPVLAGGRAVPTEQRARTLGADLWAADLAGAAQQLRADLPRQLLDPTADVGGAMAVGLDAGRWVERAMEALGAAFPGLAAYDAEQLDRTREDFGYIISFIQAATLVREPALFHEFIAWLRELLQRRGVPAAAVTLSLRALQDTRPDDVEVGRLLADAART